MACVRTTQQDTGPWPLPNTGQPSRCRWAGAPRGLGKPAQASRCPQGKVSGDGDGRGSGGKAGSVGAHLARGALPALPGSSRKTGVLVAEKIDSEENPCCPL